MGLLTAISNAVSGLNVNQQNLNVLSQNISNANTPNYSNEVLNQQASFISGLGTGVTTASITRTVNDFLNTEVQMQTSVSSSASAVQSYYSQIENLLGSPNSTSTLDQNITAFFTALQDEANSPSISAAATVVNNGSSLASSISGLASSLQSLQLQSDNDISSAISSANSDLQSLNSINTALEQAAATGQSTAGLLDQRDAAIKDLSQYIDVNATTQTDGVTTLNTTGGVTLLAPGIVTKISYSGANGTATFANNQPLSAITVSTVDANGNAIGNPSILATAGTATSVTTSLVSGKIKGLLSVRDSIIPNILSQLDQLAGTIRDQVNAITNKGSAYPPPNSLTGTRLVSGNSTSQYSGSIQIAVLDSSGNPVTSPYADEPNGLAPLTLDLGTLNSASGTAGLDSVDSIIKAINQYYGPPQNKAELGSLNNVQLGVVSNTVPDSNNSLSFNFNLNNISSANATTTITGVTILDGNGNNITTEGGSVGAMPATVTADTGTTTATGTITASLGTSSSSSYTVIAAVSTVDADGNTVTSNITYTVPAGGTTNLSGTVIGANKVDGDGTLVTPTTEQPYATAELVDANGNPLPTTNGLYGNQQGYLKIVAGNSTETIAINEGDSKELGLPNAPIPQAGTNQGFSQYFGMNNFFNANKLTSTGDTTAGSALNLSVSSTVLNNPGLVSTATLAPGNQPTDTTLPRNYTYQVASGDTSISQELAGLANTLISFGATGGMSSSTTTLSQYAGQIIAVASTNSTNATNSMNDSQTLLTGYTTRAQAVSGVNLDQELANTVIYQNAYTASTRVITVVGELFTALLGIIQ